MSDATQQQSIAACPYCQKGGLPILPLRYAITRTDSESGEPVGPPLSAPFGAGVADITLPEGQTYTLRLLRGGYLYVFNELRGSWSGYVVTERGYLFPYVTEVRHDVLAAMDPQQVQGGIDALLQPPPREEEFSCTLNPDHHYPGRCITIPNADEAGDIYLAFSDTAWTKRVWHEHATNAEVGDGGLRRRDHMRKLSLVEWRGGSAEHAAPLGELEERVAEAGYPWQLPNPMLQFVACEENGAATSTPFGHSLAPMNGIGGWQAEGLQRWANAQAEPLDTPPVMVALEDPVGIAADLAVLMGVRLHEKMADPAHARPLAISSAIANIRQSIRDDAENRQIYRTERRAYQLVYGGGHGAGGAALAGALSTRVRERQQEMLERWRDPTPEQLAAARDSAWSDYSSKLDKPRLESWESTWQKEMQAFDTEQLAPLANAHVQWMQGDSLYEQLDAQHDDLNPDSGAAFVDTLLLCIQDTQEYAPCAALYERWLSATAVERRNLLLRALGYNQELILKQWEGQVRGGLQPEALRGLPWDALITGYGETLDALSDGSQNAVVRLTSAVGGPFGKVAASAVDRVVGPALVAMGVIARAPVMLVDVTMGKGQAIAELVARMVAINPEVGTLDDLNRAIDIQMRKARIFGTPVEGTGRHRYLIMADPRVVGDFPGKDDQGNARRFAKAVILTSEDRKEMTRLRWRQLLPTEAGLGVVAGILQIIALGKLADDLANSLEHEKNENRWRYHAGIAGLVGVLSETVGRWSESASQAGSRLGRFIERYLGRFLRFAGRGLGIGVGGVMAIWDGVRGWKELKEGNAVGWLYFASMGSMLIATVAFTKLGAMIFGAASTGVGIVLVVLVIVIAVLIEIFKDNKVKDWLECCYFGKFEEDERYQNPELEVHELELALNEMKG
ncbi:T6SS effector BTH_I2691 family protein [Halomonas mongoliensis]|uniref:T6SS effector BTH_I2691 family protein n=1 Tax=Halomonas mongoliensis TaxID=321265 RepID=UPI00403AE1B4